VLDDHGTPTPVERALIVPPHGQIGAITEEQRQAIIASSVLAGVYEAQVDKESAYESLKARAEHAAAEAERQQAEDDQLAEAKREMREKPMSSPWPSEPKPRRTSGRSRSRNSDSLAESIAKSAARSASSQLGRSLTRGILGSLFGKKR
jgi:hypothetical protein